MGELGDPAGEERECDTLIHGTVVTMDPERRVLERGIVAIKDGRILGVHAQGEAPRYRAQQVLDGDQLVLPGLINTHSHLVQGCIRGMAEGTTFEERLFGFYYPMTGACDRERSYWSAIAPIVDLLSVGVTTTADDHFTHVHKDSIDGVLDALRDSGIRARMARLIINEPTTVPEPFRETVDFGLAETERLRSTYTTPIQRVTASSIGITYVTPGDLRAIHAWTIDNGTQFDIHAPAFMDRKYLAERRGWEGGSFEWLDKEGMLGPNVLAAHAQGLQAGEHRLIADRGATVTLIPDMESILGWVHFDASQFLEDEVILGLGLDGPVVSYGHNLWLAMKSFLIAQRMHNDALARYGAAAPKQGVAGDELVFGSAELALELATIGAARSLGWDDEIGSLETGKAADVVVLDLSKDTTCAARAALLANLVYAGGPRPDAVRAVFVAGRPVVEHGEPVHVDRAEIVARAKQAQEELLVECDAQSFVRRRTRWKWTT